MITAGIDLGSNSIKTLFLKDQKEIIGFDIRKSKFDYQKIAEESFYDLLNKVNLKKSDIYKIVATGYGRLRCSFADKEISEISCHAKGAYFTFPTARSIIDIGGQDCKVIALSENGKVIDFVMNDKCAAGTGKFLEVMANTLDEDISNFGKIGAFSKKDLKITNTCTVFAESEVISLISQGENKEDIITALHRSVGLRIFSLAARLNLEDDLIITGGVAKNIGIINSLTYIFERKILVPKEPQLIGALGAALFAGEN